MYSTGCGTGSLFVLQQRSLIHVKSHRLLLQRRGRVKLTHDVYVFYSWKCGSLSFSFTHPPEDYKKQTKKSEGSSLTSSIKAGSNLFLRLSEPRSSQLFSLKMTLSSCFLAHTSCTFWSAYLSNRLRILWRIRTKKIEYVRVAWPLKHEKHGCYPAGPINRSDGTTISHSARLSFTYNIEVHGSNVRNSWPQQWYIE